MDTILHFKSVRDMEKVLRYLPAKLVNVLDLRRLIKFGLVGILATFVYYLALWCMVEILNIPVLLATSIAFVLVTIENYLLHYKWTFRSSNDHFIAFPRFILMSAGGFIINLFVMFAGVKLWGFNYLLVQAVAIVMVVSWNFVLTHFWIFNE